jgi:dephospho-CoA kinase
VTDNDRKLPFRIGLTGGIASGKSTVADMFAELGASIVDTDVIAREVVRAGEPALGEIRERFGESVIDETGNLDRSTLRKLVFSDDDARLDLEKILHPRIGLETRRQAEAASGPYQIIVVPLLVGSALLQFVERVLVVDCNEETQMQRLRGRDAETAEQAHRMLAAQASRDARLSIADDVISNDQDLEKTLQQVVLLDRIYKDLACH